MNDGVLKTSPFDRVMRWAQLTLVEDDPGKYDPDFWLDYFKRIKADGVCLGAGGCVAYYPTRIPLHRRSAWMGDSDPFGYLVTGCRKLGMVVLARTDPHAFHDDMYAAHPDWVAVDAAGDQRRHWASPEMWVACTVGPYGFDFMTQVHAEIIERYGVDGIFVNRWAGSGLCHCAHCQNDFKAEKGLDLPTELARDPADPVRRAVVTWEEERLFRLWAHWDRSIRATKPEARLIPNTGGGALSHLDMREAGLMADMLVADRQARSGLSLPWLNGRNGKEYRSTLGDKPAAGLFSVGIEESYRWKDSVQGEAELRIWVAEGTAHGLRPWFCKFSGFLHDRRWLKPVEDIFVRHHSMERYLKGGKPIASVAMVYSQQTARFYGGARAREKVEDHILGMYHALVEARVPFEMVHDRMLSPENVAGYRLLILPNISALSASQCDQLRGYVERGGSILATFETSLYDETGVRRKDFGLADLFGVSCQGPVVSPQRNSYMRIVPDPSTGEFHPLVAGLEDAGRIINGARGLRVRSRGGLSAVPLILVPSYPDLPMEKVYPRPDAEMEPGVAVRETGAGRVVYFPWDIDRTFWEVQYTDHGRLLRNAVAWAVNEEPTAVVTGPGLLDVAVWRQPDSLTVHMVNLTNPMAMKGPFRELIPLAGQRIRVKLPMGKKSRCVKFLVSGSEPVVEELGGGLAVSVPPILDHEILAIDL